MNTAFIGLDYIVDIMQHGGKIAGSADHAAEQRCIENANQALTVARKKGWLTILVKVGFSIHYQEQPKQSPLFGQLHELKALRLGDIGTNFHKDLDVHPKDLIIAKPRVSAFYGTPLDAALRANQIERLVIGGVSSEWAVQATARDAHDRDYQVCILEEACAAHTKEAHESSMKTLSVIAKIIHLADLTSM